MSVALAAPKTGVHRVGGVRPSSVGCCGLDKLGKNGSSMKLESADQEAEEEEEFRAALEVAPHVKSFRIRVKVEKGFVTLSGRTASFFQLQMAQEAIMRISNGYRVLNEIQVD